MSLLTKIFGLKIMDRVPEDPKDDSMPAYKVRLNDEIHVISWEQAEWIGDVIDEMMNIRWNTLSAIMLASRRFSRALLSLPRYSPADRILKMGIPIGGAYRSPNDEIAEFRKTLAEEEIDHGRIAEKSAASVYS